MLNTVLLIIIPFICLILPEIIIRGGSESIAWISSHPTQFIVSYAILFGLINTWYVLPRRMYATVGALTASLLTVGGFISHQKLILRGEPLLPWDFKIGKEALNISQNFEYFNSLPTLLFIVICVFTAVIWIGFRLIPKENYRFPHKFSTALPSLALVLILVQPVSLQEAFSLNLIDWNQKANYTENGMVLSFILNTNATRLAFLGSYVLDRSMNTGSTLTGFLSTLYAQGSTVITAAQYRHHEKLSAEDCAKYALLQYDCLIGNEYVYKFNPLNKPIVNHQFVLGHGPVVVDNVLYPDNHVLEVEGMDFCQNHIVYVNNSPVDTEFVDGTLLKAALPVAYLNSDEALFVQVKLADHGENIITESEVYTVTSPLAVN